MEAGALFLWTEPSHGLLRIPEHSRGAESILSRSRAQVHRLPAQTALGWRGNLRPIVSIPQSANGRLKRKRSPGVLPHESRAGAARHSLGGRIDEQALVRVKSMTGNDHEAALETRHALYCRILLFGGDDDDRVCCVLAIARSA
jgi:hypothetical protein